MREMERTVKKTTEENCEKNSEEILGKTSEH